MKYQRNLPLACLCGAILLSAPFSRSQPAPQPPVRGPFWSGTIRGPKTNRCIALKGIAVTVGAEKNAYLCFDADMMRVALAWSGEFLEFGNTLSRIEWPPPPQVKGTPVFETGISPGWSHDGSFEDPRDRHHGPLPKSWAHYEGLYVNGDQVVFKYKVNGVQVLETPGYQKINDQPLFTRTFEFLQDSGDQGLLVADGIKGNSGEVEFTGDTTPIAFNLESGGTLTFSAFGLPKGTRLASTPEGRLVLKLSHAPANQPFRLAYSQQSNPAGFAAIHTQTMGDLRDLCKGGASRWSETVSVKGVLGTGDEPYVVDTITEPAANPYRARTFFGGFDFFSDGRAAICTFHGDVWIVSGIDDSLGHLTWKRFASGLFQPLGLKIVNDTVYVLGRDQITILRDLNHDGEADSYENFNNDTIVTANYHEFCLDLTTDQEGNFYFAKGAPWEPEVTSTSQGCLFKLPPDGSKLEVIATGLRAPNGMTVGPHDEITVSDNQGHWMPSSKLDWIEKGGFYGMVPSAQRELEFIRDGTNFTANPSLPEDRQTYGFRTWGNAKVPRPVSYNKPLCWLPMSMDNSSGAQVWVTSDKWGPLGGQLLFSSYGKCTLFEVMPDVVDGTRQGAMIQFPLVFRSGLMRARVNPHDGQVYLCGLKGWQTAATRDGGFYRVRYTGKPVRMPNAFHASLKGVRIAFTTPVDPKTAADPENYGGERWNYIYSGAYGSPEVSVDHPDPKHEQHDRLEIKSAKVLPDGKSVFLEIADMKACDQIKIKYNVNAADGGAMAQEIYGTIYKLLAE